MALEFLQGLETGMQVVGLTGGIACGKSAVAEGFRARGVAVIDADAVARDVVLPGSEGLAAVVDAFGPEVLAADGSLDRKKLGQRVFTDATARATLNGILHPRIGAESARRFAELAAEGHRFALYEAALLVENGVYRGMAALVVVSAAPEVQRARLMARDGSTRDEAQARIDAQWPLAEKVSVADWVIDNSGDREALTAQVTSVYEALVARFGAPR